MQKMRVKPREGGVTVMLNRRDLESRRSVAISILRSVKGRLYPYLEVTRRQKRRVDKKRVLTIQSDLPAEYD